MLRRKGNIHKADPTRDADLVLEEPHYPDDELSPREVMARLTATIERKIDASFKRKAKIDNEHA